MAVLADGLVDIGIDVERIPLGDTVARLEGRTLYLDTCSGPDELCWAMTEALAAVTLGEGAAPSAQPARPRLRSVG